MKTWLLVAASSTALVYYYDSVSHNIQLIRKIRNRSRPDHRGGTISRFTTYLSEEMELACGAGTSANLIVCAESSVLTLLMPKLSSQVKSSILDVLKISNMEHKIKDARIKANPLLMDEVKGSLEHKPSCGSRFK